jgi:hypothetical protein
VPRILPLVLIALVVAACGGPPTEDAKVRDVVTGYHRAIADHDVTAFCSYVAPDMLVRLDAGGGCPAVAEQLLKAARETSRSPDIAAVKITGDTAVVESPYGYEPISLQRVSGRWFINLPIAS